MGEIKKYEAKLLQNNKEIPLYHFELSRDKLGRIVKKIEKFDHTERNKRHHNHHDLDDRFEYRYEYDRTGRLVEVENHRRSDSRYFYDQNSNRIMGSASGERFEAIYDSQDRLLRYNSFSSQKVTHKCSLKITHFMVNNKRSEWIKLSA